MIPESKGLTLYVLTLCLLFTSILIVMLRCLVRFRIKGFGMDDWLMTVAEGLFIATCAAVAIGCRSGIGIKDDRLSEEARLQVKHAIVAFQCFYCATLIFIKTSICSALMRIAVDRKIIVSLYVIMVLSVSYAFIAMVTVLAQCHPLQASWDLNAGTCSSNSVIVNISYFVSACSIFTDFSCSILPFIILWQIQMCKKLKFTVCGILAMGLIASSATIVRFFYLDAYTAPVNYAYDVADVVIWSLVEVGLGICAGSAPALRPLLRGVPLFHSSHGSAGKESGMDRARSPSILNLVALGNQGRVSVRCSTAPQHGDSESTKGFMRDEGVMITSEVVVRQGQRHSHYLKVYDSY